MITINLLPWREQQRVQQKRHLIVMFVIGLTISLFVGLITYWVLDKCIERQQARNQFLQKAIDNVDVKIKIFKALEEAREDLLLRLQVIEHLQENRSDTAELFTFLIKQISPQIILTNFSREDDNLLISGVARNNAAISQLMANLRHSPELSTPELKEIYTSKENNVNLRHFSLKVQEKNDNSLVQAKTNAKTTNGTGGAR